MSLLRNQRVNPLNTPVEQAPQQFAQPMNDAAFQQPVQEQFAQQPVQEQFAPPQFAQQPMAAQAAYVQPYQPQAPAAYNPLTTYAGMPANDGFDDLDTGYGSFPRIKLDGNLFKLDSEKLGTEFIANLFQVRKLFVYRDSKATDGTAQVAYTYDHVLSANGERMDQILARWKAKGVIAPEIEERSEAAATILEGPHAGMVVMLSIPKQSSKKLAGYRDVLKHTKGRTVPQVKTRVYVGDSINTGNTTFTPWAFEYAGDFQAQQAA